MSSGNIGYTRHSTKTNKTKKHITEIILVKRQANVVAILICFSFFFYITSIHSYSVCVTVFMKCSYCNQTTVQESQRKQWTSLFLEYFLRYQ
jgi:hypothetical protein